MTSRFVNQFKKNDHDEQRTFQRKVHGLLSQIYPERIFEICEDPLTLKHEDTVIGLTNLRSEFLLSPQTTPDLEELIKIRLGVLFNKAPDDHESEWETVKGSLMPQLMPQSFVGRAPIKLVHKPFGDGVVVGFVVDSEASYAYVHEENLESWGVKAESVSDAAFENLNLRSKGIQMVAFPGVNAFFVINTMDGFDAARLLLPEMQEVIAEQIGSPFYAGVPNRDFLICWSKSGDRDFLASMRSQVAKDSEERPYPLSGKVFEVQENGRIELACIGGSDPRAENAELN